MVEISGFHDLSVCIYPWTRCILQDTQKCYVHNKAKRLYHRFVAEIFMLESNLYALKIPSCQHRNSVVMFKDHFRPVPAHHVLLSLTCRG